MSSSMDFGDIPNVESILFEEGVTLAPMSCGAASAMGAQIGATTVLAAASLRDVQTGGLAGIVVPGGDVASELGGASGFDKMINTARAEHLPVMAFGDGVGRTLEALGYEPTGEMPPGVLLHDGVRILETEAEVREAIAPFRS